MCRGDISDSRWSEHIEATKLGFSPAKFIFTPREVLDMWNAWIDHEMLFDHVSCSVMPRIHLRSFSLMYPANTYDLVYPQPLSSDSAEHLRARLFPKLLDRPLHEVIPEFQLHNSEIRKLVILGRKWSDFIPSGAYEIFSSIHGQERVRNSEIPNQSSSE